MDTKAAFEKWLKDEYTWGAEALEQCRWQPFGKGDGYYICNERYDFLHFMFVAWAASLSAIEIQLPNPEDYHCSGSAEAALIDVSAAITSHGIKVKS